MAEKQNASKLVSGRKSLAYHLTSPAVGLLARTHVTPTGLTWIGLVLSLFAAVLIGSGYTFAAGFVVLVAGYFDILDGALARRTNRITRFGGIFDSTVDRIAESAILLGIMVLFLFGFEDKWVVLLAGIALPSSLLVSYIRARAETLNIKCEVGIFTRAERVVILALGLLINQVVIALGIITLLSLITIVQRLAHVYQQTRNRG